MRARTGKIARLPFAIREELNRQLLDGYPARKIKPWINSLPETKQMVAEMQIHKPYSHCKDIVEIDDRNISDWRKTGYAEWLARRQRLDETKELALFAGKMSKVSDNNLADGAAAILSAGILQLLENSESKNARELVGLTKALVALRGGDHNREMVNLKREKVALDTMALELDHARFQRQTCELFIRWAEDQRAKDLLSGTCDNAEKISKLGALMFGAEWKQR